MNWTQQTITFLELTDTRKRPVLVNVADISYIHEYDGYSGIARISGGQEVYVKETCTEIIAAMKGAK